MRIGGYNPYKIANVQKQIMTKKDVTENKQKIDLKANQTKSLGSLNGKPFDFTMLSGGGFTWSGGLMIRLHSGNKLNAEDLAAAEAYNAYTKEEHQEANNIIGVINQMYLVTSRNQDVDYFNNLVKQNSLSADVVEEAFIRMGVDPSQQFTVNGRNFILESGVLKELR